MPNPQKTKRHHFVPECYLKNFISDKDLVVLDIRNVQKGYKTKLMYRQPAQICYLNNYYTINNQKQHPLFLFQDLDSLYIEDEVLPSLEKKYQTLFSELVSSDHVKMDRIWQNL